MVTAKLSGSGIVGPSSGGVGNVSPAQRMVRVSGSGRLMKIPSFGCAAPKLRLTKSGAIAARRLSSVLSLHPGRERFVKTEGSNAMAPVGKITIVRCLFEKNGNSNGNENKTGARTVVSRLSFGNVGNGALGLSEKPYGC